MNFMPTRDDGHLIMTILNFCFTEPLLRGVDPFRSLPIVILDPQRCIPMLPSF